MNAKDFLIEVRKEEAEDEYREWLEFLDQQQEWIAQLVEHGYIPTTKESHHA